MKNIIIVGVSRAGKTTLAQAVARAIGATGMAVSFISADALFGGVTEIKKAFPVLCRICAPIKASDTRIGATAQTQSAT